MLCCIGFRLLWLVGKGLPSAVLPGGLKRHLMIHWIVLCGAYSIPRLAIRLLHPRRITRACCIQKHPRGKRTPISCPHTATWCITFVTLVAGNRSTIYSCLYLPRRRPPLLAAQQQRRWASSCQEFRNERGKLIDVLDALSTQQWQSPLDVPNCVWLTLIPLAMHSRLLLQLRCARCTVKLRKARLKVMSRMIESPKYISCGTQRAIQSHPFQSNTFALRTLRLATVQRGTRTTCT